MADNELAQRSGGVLIPVRGSGRTGPRTKQGKRIASLNSLKDGSSSPVIITQVARTIRKTYIPWLEEHLPWLSDAEAPMLEILILKRARLVLLHRWLADHGEYDIEGNVRNQALRAEKAENEIAAILEKLGATPAARFKIGIDMSRGMDLAAQMAAPRNGGKDG